MKKVAQASSLESGLLVCTLGTSPAVIAELLAKLDSPKFWFFGKPESARAAAPADGCVRCHPKRVARAGG